MLLIHLRGAISAASTNDVVEWSSYASGGSKSTLDEYLPGPAVIPGPSPVTKISVLTSFFGGQGDLTAIVHAVSAIMQENGVLRPRNIRLIQLYGLVHQTFISQHASSSHHTLAEVKKFIASNIMEKIPNVIVDCKGLKVASEEINTASLKFATDSLIY